MCTKLRNLKASAGVPGLLKPTIPLGCYSRETERERSNIKENLYCDKSQKLKKKKKNWIY